MRIVLLHGQRHKGSTYHISQLFLDGLKDEDTEINEFYFNGNSPCIGCYNCFLKGEDKCPHYEENHAAIEAIEKSDLIIMESPCYCMGITGQLKIFLDHLGYRWMSHRPHKNMFSKVGVCISTAAGAGAKKVTKDMAQHLFYWGVASIFRYHKNVGAASWNEVSERQKRKIEGQVKKRCVKIKGKINKSSPTIKLKSIFYIMRMSQRNNEWSLIDKEHWEEYGWIADKRPWC